MRLLVPVFGALLITLASVGCQGGDTQPTQTPTPTADTSTQVTTPSTLPTPTPSPTPPLAAALPDDVRPVVEALASGDPARVAGVLRFEPVACVLRQDGIGAPPLCPDGVAEGTLIDGFPAGVCEGYWLTRDQIEADLAGREGLLDFLTQPAAQLYGVSRPVLDGHGRPLPAGSREFTVVFTGLKYGWAGAASVEGGLITSWHTACGATAEDLLGAPPRVEVLVGPPPGTPRPYPYGTQTGETGLDRLITAFQQAQFPVLESLMETRDVACQVQPRGPVPLAPACLSAMEEGTVIPAFLVLREEGQYVAAVVMRSRLSDFAWSGIYVLAVKRFPLRTDTGWNRDGAMVFWRPQGGVRVAWLDGDRLSAIWFVGDGQPLEEVFEQLPDGVWVLPPR